MSVDPIALLALHELHRRRMTIRELADRAGVNRSVLGRWLGGSRSIRVRQAAMVMQVLDLVVVARRDLHGTDAPTQGNRLPHRARPA